MQHFRAIYAAHPLARWVLTHITQIAARLNFEGHIGTAVLAAKALANGGRIALHWRFLPLRLRLLVLEH
jgi:hypothetical protein